LPRVSRKQQRDATQPPFAGLATKLRGQEPDFEERAREFATPGGINEQFLGLPEEAHPIDATDLGFDRVLDRLASRSPAAFKKLE
jgi:hypothetical protein